MTHTHGGDFFMNKRGQLERSHGIRWFVTGLFLAGHSAGAGMVALSTAAVRAGIIPITALILVCMVTSIYTADLLGNAWLILLRRWPQYQRQHCRNPYPEIAYRAMGRRMARVVSVVVSVNQFGYGVVYLLLCAKNLHDAMIAFFSIDISTCLMVVILGVVLLPLTFLKSPQDFWGALVLALLCSGVSATLIIFGSALDYKMCQTQFSQAPFSITNLCLAIGTVFFSSSGHGSFPTVQHDMRRPADATKAAVFGFTMIVAAYLPVAAAGYFTYGDSLGDSIINSIQLKWIQQTVNLLITAHCIFALTLVMNPTFQECEELFKVPQAFGPKRVALRATVMAAAVFVAESAPNFGPMLDFIGGSTLTFLNLIFPCLFYLFLKVQDSDDASAVSMMNGSDRPRLPSALAITVDKRVYPEKDIWSVELDEKKPAQTMTLEWPDNGVDELCPLERVGLAAAVREIFTKVDRRTLIYCSLILVFGIVGGSAATFSAVRTISYTKFVAPCYVSVFNPATNNETTSSLTTEMVHCCGTWQNISRYGHEGAAEHCVKPNLHFYD